LSVFTSPIRLPPGTGRHAKNLRNIAPVTPFAARRRVATLLLLLRTSLQQPACYPQQTEDRVRSHVLRLRKSNEGTRFFGHTDGPSTEPPNQPSRHVVGLACGLALFAALISVQPAAAQSTIFNIPSTDTVAPKHGYFEFDFLPQAPTPSSGSFQTYTPRVVAGVTPQLEIGANFSNTHVSDGGGTLTYFQPNGKFKFYANDDQGLAATAGVIGYIAANHRDELTDYKDFTQFYANVSKKFKAGARFTAGLWGSAGLNDNKFGVLAGYEQPLSGKISFVADWFSGNNYWGYFTPGVAITLPYNSQLNIGYSIGNNSYSNDPANNDDTHNRAVFIYYGITFGSSTP
jgi:hypothetical protein